MLRLGARVADAAALPPRQREAALLALAPALADPALPAPLVAGVQGSLATYARSGRVAGLLADVVQAPGAQADWAVAVLRSLPGTPAGQQQTTARAALAELPRRAADGGLRPDVAAVLRSLLEPVAAGTVTA